MSVASVEWQNVKAIKTLFDSRGWKIFEGHINDLIGFEKCYIENTLKNAVKPENINDLNFHLAKKQVLDQILMLKETLIDEISPTEEPEHNSSQDNE